MADRGPKLLFLTTELPWPPDSGGRIKSYRLIKHLSEHFSVNVLCAYGGKRREKILELKAATGARVQAFDTHRPRTLFNWVRSFLFYPTFNSFRIDSPELRAMIGHSIAAADVVIADHLEVLDLIEENQLRKVLYHGHNAEHVLWRSQAKITANPVVKSLMRVEANRLASFERWAVGAVRFFWLAPDDLRAIEALKPFNIAPHAPTYHLGHDEWLDEPMPELSANQNRVIFAGTLSWPPNRDALAWFILKIWPKILREVPDATIAVCGPGADADMKTILKNTHNANYLGFVDNLQDEMGKAAVAVVPLRSGSGMKVKTLDAMYRGIPVVTTHEGISGIDATHGRDVLLADTDEHFANEVIRLLKDRALATSIAQNARKLVSEKYTYRKLMDDMVSTIKNMSEPELKRAG
ncbi:MAG: glycosyltransferase family 4 protein [Salibacteraceae bacterium]